MWRFFYFLWLIIDKIYFFAFLCGLKEVSSRLDYLFLILNDEEILLDFYDGCGFCVHGLQRR